VAFYQEYQPELSPNYSIPNQQINTDSIVYSITPAGKKVNQEQQNTVSNKNEREIKSNIEKQRAEKDLVVSNTRSNQSKGPLKNEPDPGAPATLSSAQNKTAGNNNRFSNEIESVEISRKDAASTRKATVIVNSNNNKTDDLYKEVTANQPATKARMIIKNDTDQHFDIVLQRLPKDSQPAMQEVVVGSGVEGKSIDKYPKVTIDTLEPAEGYVHFDDYVISNLQMPEELKTKSISGGEVQLAFDVDENGQAINITVIKSLCAKCDEEAIRLLKEGPKWKKKKNKKGKITIEF
jgi:hypothetical protein